MVTEWDLKKLLKIVAVGDIFHRLDVIFDNQPQWQSTEGSVVNHWQAVKTENKFQELQLCGLYVQRNTYNAWNWREEAFEPTQQSAASCRCQTAAGSGGDVWFCVAQC